MALVGDMIFRTRSSIPDLPPTLPVPNVVSTTIIGGGSLQAGVYYLVVTQRNAWGETLPSIEYGPYTVNGLSALQIICPLLPSAVAIRAYLTLPNGAPGTEIQFVESAASPLIIAANPSAASTPPSRATAYMMDSDGRQFSCGVLYSWLNEALNVISRAVGGVLDYCGVPTQAGQPLYVLPGEWVEISDVWYGGYWVQGGQRSQFFRRDAITTDILSNVVISVFSDKQIMEVSYQPDRDSGATTLTNPISATDTSANINDVSGFLLPFGFVQFGTEIMAYSNLFGATISGLIRGIGGSTAQPWPTATPVTELSLFWNGKRLFGDNTYSPGQSATPLAVPQGWESVLPLYMLGQAKKSELDMQAGAALEKQAIAQAKDLMMANKGVVRMVQVGGYGMGRPLTFSQTPAGGIIIPGI